MEGFYSIFESLKTFCDNNGLRMVAKKAGNGISITVQPKKSSSPALIFPKKERAPKGSKPLKKTQEQRDLEKSYARTMKVATNTIALGERALDNANIKQ